MHCRTEHVAGRKLFVVEPEGKSMVSAEKMEEIAKETMEEASLSAWELITKRAQALVDASTVPSFAAGVTAVVHRDPALYQQYKAESRPGPVAKSERPAPGRESTAYTAIRKVAEQMVAAGAVSTVEQGVVQVLRSRPDLHRAYQAEKRGR
jgi:hypothetical protein